MAVGVRAILLNGVVLQIHTTIAQIDRVRRIASIKFDLLVGAPFDDPLGSRQFLLSNAFEDAEPLQQERDVQLFLDDRLANLDSVFEPVSFAAAKAEEAS